MKIVKTSITLPSNLHALLKQKSKEQRISQSAYISFLLEKEFTKQQLKYKGEKNENF